MSTNNNSIDRPFPGTNKIIPQKIVIAVKSYQTGAFNVRNIETNEHRVNNIAFESIISKIPPDLFIVMSVDIKA